MDTVVLLCADVGEELGKGKLSGDHNKAVLQPVQSVLQTVGKYCKYTSKD